MTHTKTHLKANSLKQQAELLAETLWSMRNGEGDLSRRNNRVYLSQTSLPGFPEVLFDGGARFDKNGVVKAIGLRGNDSEVTEEFVLRTTRSRTTIIRKVQAPKGNLVTIMEACYNNSNRLLRYREEVKAMRLAG